MNLQQYSYSIKYKNPNLIFRQLCKDKQNTILLEYTDTINKELINSIMGISSSVRITLKKNEIIYKSINQNGINLLSNFVNYLNDFLMMYIDNDQNSSFKINNLLDIDGCIKLYIYPSKEDKDADKQLKSISVFDGLRAIQEYLKTIGDKEIYLTGFFSYDLVTYFIELDNELQETDLDTHDYNFYIIDQLIYIDHKTKYAEIRGFSFSKETHKIIDDEIKYIKKILDNNTNSGIKKNKSTNSSDIKVSVTPSEKDFRHLIENIKKHLNLGDVFQIVPSRCFSLPCNDPFSSYIRLKDTNKSPYMFYMQDEEYTIFGSCPELAIKYTKENNQIEVNPIAGSRPRGFNEDGSINYDLDTRLELELRLDKKEQIEHLMLVDLARNDVARISHPGTRKVVDLMKSEKYSHIMHLVSRVIGQLRDDIDPLHAYQSTMNMGTLTGAPKIKAMQLLYKYEQKRRNSYAGAIGYLTSHDNLNTSIIIRSAFVKNNTAYIQAGCGCVLDSKSQSEVEETKHKALAIVNAIAYIENDNKHINVDLSGK